MHPVLFHIGSVLIPSYGAAAALGVLLALALALHTARRTGVNPNHLWNLCIVALFSGLLGARLLLVLVNWTDLRRHPLWMMGLATIHHPLLTAAGALAGAAAAIIVGRVQRMPLWPTLDALAAPLALSLACEQLGEFLAGSSYGTMTAVRWAVTYTDPLAERWSGVPIGIPLHPVQLYAALAFLALAGFLLFWLPRRRQQGDAAGIWLLASGVTVFVTEFWRDREGRGAVLGGALDGPQIAALVLVLAGGLALLDRTGAQPQFDGSNRKDEATHV